MHLFTNTKKWYKRSPIKEEAMKKAGLLTTAALAVTFLVANDTVAQSSSNQRAFKASTEVPNTIQMQAADYTRDNAALGVIVMRGPENEEAFNAFMNDLSAKLTEKGIPHKFFVEVVDKPGAAFAYFVNERQHGPFGFKEFVAMLPEAVRDFKKAHPTVTTASIKGTGVEKQVAGL